MATAKKLPSGSWRMQVFDHTDGKGKNHYKSFTGKTRQEVERMAARYKCDISSSSSENLTVFNAIQKYIELKKNVLSPSTVREYINMEHLRYDLIGNKKIEKLSTADVQLWISSLVETLSPKSIKNTYGLFISSIKMFYPGKNFDVTLPQAIKPDLHTPTDKEVEILLKHVEGKESNPNITAYNHCIYNGFDFSCDISCDILLK